MIVNAAPYDSFWRVTIINFLKFNQFHNFTKSRKGSQIGKDTLAKCLKGPKSQKLSLEDVKDRLTHTCRQSFVSGPIS